MGLCLPVKKGIKFNIELDVIKHEKSKEKIELIELWSGEIITDNFYDLYESDIKRVKTNHRLILYPVRGKKNE